MPFEPANNIIALLRRQLGLDELTFAVLRIWERDMAPQVPYARLAAVKKGYLLLEVDTSVQFHEMNLRRHEFVRKINQYFGKEKAIKDIKVRLKTEA